VEVVRSTWEKLVLDESKDVFVLIHDPKDKHSIDALHPMKELAEHCAGVKDMMIAQIDVTQNEVDRVDISHLPAFKLYPKGK